ncbi:EthD domain-containing protein [Pseudomonas sp. NFPP10]|uniref:EthD domain-containing protein n=1 Tax=unclassified Pseudomonas TaxID=196821 RepID=UPI000884FC7F|nr:MULTISPECIES: EthD domain-containing protein [unclassified Pseudomonas]SDA34829.1 EthD domain-containing protein [Pseudomonas sp. NFPP12]SEM67297.1 EthD domain-containing protein [Pseudomonas sp. NFPP10]SFK28362.1 EthD domain-containing protein [Pseudomonas sp. NFPP08]SFN73627.1 EthD domain-containing protein [Pseudomonas sp. NFPP05]SFY05582.1 EthD domain-containing protein [Pseudomonas sp. NFPP09]
MEKVIYLLWRDPSSTDETFARHVRHEVIGQLQALGAQGLQLNLADSEVAPAAALRQENRPRLPDACLSLWLDSANAAPRAPFDRVLAQATTRLAAYLVCESEAIRNTRFPPSPGERTYGFAQVALLTRPPRLTPQTWLEIWRNQHTEVAIVTQANFQYVQNLVVAALTPDAPPIDAIVEECFPPAAMTDPQAFFDATGDEARFEKNLAAMMQSCARFIDFDKIDVLPTSQYRF